MRRLFTFGCSFTHYRWPSWADILGVEFDSHQNWGHSGIGNRAIAERIAECHAVSNINSNDIVVVQWSNYTRHDWMHSRKRHGDTSYWRTKGSIFSAANEKVFNHIWVEKFWDEKAYYLHTLNSILLAQGLLKSTGCGWAMTSLTNLQTVDIDLSDIIEQGYFQRIWDDNKSNWITTVKEFREQYPDAWHFKPSANEPAHHRLNNGVFTEGHMPVNQQAMFTEEVKRALGMAPGLSAAQANLVAEINSIKDTHDQYDDFINAVNKTNWSKSVTHLGY